MRALVVLLLLLVPVVPPAAATSQRPAHQADVVRALDVLHHWDERRARAWADSDEAALRALYLPGSPAGRADVRLLRSYTAHHLVVRRLVTQVFGVRVLVAARQRISLRVLDRVAGGEVVMAQRVLPLSSTRPVVRRLSFHRDAGTWRLVSATP